MFFRGIILEIHSRFCLLMCFVSGKIDKCDCVCIFKSKAFINPTGHSDGQSVESLSPRYSATVATVVLIPNRSLWVNKRRTTNAVRRKK